MSGLGAVEDVERCIGEALSCASASRIEALAPITEALLALGDALLTADRLCLFSAARGLFPPCF